MQLRVLWQHRGPVLRWSLFALAVSATAVGTYLFVPGQPRWVLEAGPQHAVDVGDGMFVTYASPEGKAAGPLRLWDAATGTELAQFLASGEPFHTFAIADDGRHFVCLSKGDKPEIWCIRGVDLRERREWQADIKVGEFISATFSPRCDFVYLRMQQREDSAEYYTIVETTSGRIVAHLPGAVDAIRFAENGRCVAAGYSDEEDGGEIRVVDTATGKTTIIARSSLLSVSPDGRWLIGERTSDGVWLWDVAGSRWHTSLGESKAKRTPRIAGSYSIDVMNEAAYSVNYRAAISGLQYLALTSSKRATSRRGIRGWAHLRHFRFYGLREEASLIRIFSPDSRYLLCTVPNTADQPQLALLDVQTGKTVWTRNWHRNAEEPMFTPDSRQIIVPGAEPIEILDAATGRTDHTIPYEGLVNPTWRLSRDGRTLIAIASPPQEEPHWLWAKIQGWFNVKSDNECTLVRAYALESGSLHGELRIEEADQQWLTEDRQSVVTIESESNDQGLVATTIACWDMPPRKPLVWPVTVALLLLSLRFGWTRMRRGPKRGSKSNETT